MHICTMQTRSFSFIATGNTPHMAHAAMAVAWQRHCRQYGLETFGEDALFSHFDDLIDNCSMVELEPGEAARDGERL